MRICCLSDGHGHLPDLTNIKADLFLYSGDLCPTYDHSDTFQHYWLTEIFAEWVNTIPGRLIYCYGNHDLVGRHGWFPKSEAIYLNDDYTDFRGLRIWGYNFQLPFGDGWAFNASEEQLRHIYGKCDRADIIVSHGPPYGYGDKAPRGKDKWENAGSKALVELIDRVNPKLLVCGHLHSGYGIYKRGETTIVNAALLNEQYQLVREPIVLEF